MSRSSAWLKLMINTKLPGVKSITASCTGSECSVLTCAGKFAGNTSSRLSIQRNSNGKSDKTFTNAPPTCPPPNKATGCNRGRNSSRSASASLSLIKRYSNSTTPPQHCPKAGPSGTVCEPGCGARPANMSLANATAWNSKWPPPMVPTKASGKTAIQLPLSRGTEPRVRVTLTNTPLSSAKRSVSCVKNFKKSPYLIGC